MHLHTCSMKLSLSGDTHGSLLGEPVPPGILTANHKIRIYSKSWEKRQHQTSLTTTGNIKECKQRLLTVVHLTSVQHAVFMGM